MEAQGHLERLPIEKICCDCEVQPRVQLNRSVVRDYFELMQSGETFPPLQIVSVDNKFILVDGYHRLEAAKMANLTTFRCLVREGDRRHAVLLSSIANFRHGLRRTNADKRRAVTKVLADPEWRQWSDRQIARHCQVSQAFVSGVRSKMREVTDNVISDNALEREGTERRFITKHGRPAVMHLAARQRPCAVTSEPIRITQSESGVTKQGEIVTSGTEGGRARFVEAVVDFEELIRATGIMTIRGEPAADQALYAQLKALARLIVEKADMLVRA